MVLAAMLTHMYVHFLGRDGPVIRDESRGKKVTGQQHINATPSMHSVPL